MSVEAEKGIGRNANAGSAHTAAHFSSKLLLPIPQSPRIANEPVLPAASPCRKASRNTLICCLRPTNSSGLTGKLGSGSTSLLQNHENHNRHCYVCDFCYFGAAPGCGIAASRCRGGRSLLVGFCCLWVGVRGVSSRFWERERGSQRRHGRLRLPACRFRA